MRRIVKILSNDELDKRYPKGVNFRMAKLTREAIDKGYSIALIEQEGLHNSNWLTQDVQVALECNTPKSSVIEVWGYTDMSQLSEDKIYCAFKEIKGEACAHSVTHCRVS